MAPAVAAHRVRHARFTPPSPASRSRRKGSPPGERSCALTDPLGSPCVSRGPKGPLIRCWSKSGDDEEAIELARGLAADDMALALTVDQEVSGSHSARPAFRGR